MSSEWPARSRIWSCCSGTRTSSRTGSAAPRSFWPWARAGRLRLFEARAHLHLALLSAAQDRTEDWRRQVLDALALAREIGDARVQGEALGSLGAHAARASRFAEARAHFAEGAALLRSVPPSSALAELLCHRAECERLAGDRAAAAAALAAAEAVLGEPGAHQTIVCAARMAALRQALASPTEAAQL